MKLLLLWLINAVSLLAVAYLMPSIVVSSFTTALIAALILGLVNTVIRPVADPFDATGNLADARPVHLRDQRLFVLVCRVVYRRIYCLGILGRLLGCNGLQRDLVVAGRDHCVRQRLIANPPSLPATPRAAIVDLPVWSRAMRWWQEYGRPLRCDFFGFGCFDVGFARKPFCFDRALFRSCCPL